MLAALVVLGMATGTRQRFDQAVAPLSAVVLVQSLGAVCVVLLAVGLGRYVVTWRGQRAHHLSRWSLAIALVWVLWALIRVGEYAS